MNKKFNELTKEYFAQKFTNPKFPIMEPSTLWVIYFALPLFYLIALSMTAESEHPVVIYSSVFAFMAAAVMFVLRVIFGRKKMIKKHPIGFIRCTVLGFGELKLFLLLLILFIASGVLSDIISEYDDEQIVNAVYIGGGAILLLDVVLNIIFRRKMKKRIIAGAYKEGGSGFFGDMKNKDKIWMTLVRVLAVVATVMFILRASRLSDIIFDDLSDFGKIFLIAVLISVVLFLFCVLAFCNALTMGRIHYIKKFGINTVEEEASIQ